MRELLISSSALILALILLRFLFRRTISRRAQYALWLLVLLRLLLPFGIGSSRFSVASVTERLPERVDSETIVTVLGGDVPDLSVREPDPALPVSEQRELYRVYRQEWKEEVDRSRIETGGRPITLRGVLRAVWLGGMGACALLILLQNLRFARRLRLGRVPLEGAESRYPVYLCDDVPSPCLFGLFRPSIYVTSAAARDERTLAYVLRHEETHARHLDPLWSLLRSLCLAVWWFDPLVWLAAHFSRIDCELACDEGVLARLGEEARIPYGETLLALIPLRRSGTPLLAATTMTAGKRQMKDRIQRIAEHKRPLAIALVLVLLLAGLVCACTFTGGKKEPEPAVSANPTTPIDRAGEYESPEAYLASLREEMTEVTFFNGKDLQEETAAVLDTRVRYLNKDGELPGLAPEGTLELYEYLIEMKLNVEPDAVLLAGGAYITEGGWCDLEGQGGHSLVLLRYPDGSVSVLHDQCCNDDRGGLYYYQESPEEMLYDWYVKENDLDLPLYTLDLLEQDPGRHPARRRDGDGWYLYIPVTGWAVENGGGGAKLVSQYGTGSSLIVRRATREEKAAERPQLMPGQRQRYVEAEDGRIWLVFTQYIPENITDNFEIAWEPELLEAMMESFTVTDADRPAGSGQKSVGSATPGDLTEPTQDSGLTDRLRAAADLVFGSYNAPAGPFRLSVEADGRRDEYTVQPGQTWSVTDSFGSLLTSLYYSWTPLTEGEIAAVDRDPDSGPVLEIRNEEERFTIYAGSDVLQWTEEGGEEHWLRPVPKESWSGPLYDFFLDRYARPAELSRPEREISVPGTVTDYMEVARQMAEQYAALLLDRPAWCQAVPYDAAVRHTFLFDAYYGEDYPNFCFEMGLYLKLDEKNSYQFQAGAGLIGPEEEGRHAGWYRWGGEVSAALEDGQWRFLGMGSGGSWIWLPYGVGWGVPEEDLTTEQLVSLYFLTWGRTRDWRLMNLLAQKPLEEVLAEMEKLSDEGRQALLRGMKRYNTRYRDTLDDAPGFDLDAYPYNILYPVYRIYAEVVGYGNDTLRIKVTDAGDSPLSVGFEMYISVPDYRPADSHNFPLGSAYEVEYSGLVEMDELGYYGPDGRTISLRGTED